MDRQNLRLTILQILNQQQAYTAHQETLISELKLKGVLVNRSQLQIELCWLEQNAEAIVDKNTGGVHIATLTGNGLEIVEGLRDVPDIRKPRPDELLTDG